MLYTVTKEFRFEAAHRLVGHDGKCARLHGHSWIGRVHIQGKLLQVGGPKDGMLLDFGDVKKVLEPIVEEYLDHHYLNETLHSDRPTSEFVAWWLFVSLKKPLMEWNRQLVAVEVEETCTSSARYGVS